VVICGDFNSKPHSSVSHVMMNKEYLITEKSNRTDRVKGVRAYRKQKGIDAFNLVDKDMKENRHLMDKVLGKFNSSYSFYNEVAYEEGRGMHEGNTEDSLLKWSKWFRSCHPDFTSYCTGMMANIDYIYYTPATMRVKSLLKLPSPETVERSNLDTSKSLPSEFFPSDHLRISTEFEVYHSGASGKL